MKNNIFTTKNECIDNMSVIIDAWSSRRAWPLDAKVIFLEKRNNSGLYTKVHSQKLLACLAPKLWNFYLLSPGMAHSATCCFIHLTKQLQFNSLHNLPRS